MPLLVSHIYLVFELFNRIDNIDDIDRCQSGG